MSQACRIILRLEEVFKEQNITRKAEQLLLLKALGLGKTITQIDGSMKLVNGSLGSVVPWLAIGNLFRGCFSPAGHTTSKPQKIRIWPAALL